MLWPSFEYKAGATRYSALGNYVVGIPPFKAGEVGTEALFW